MKVDTEADEDPGTAPSHGYRTWGGRWVAVRAKRHAGSGPGEVWKVRDQREEGVRGPRSMYALKQMKVARGPHTMAFKRFVREIETTQRIAASHSGIVQVVDFQLEVEPGATPYYVMPRADETLAAVKGLSGAAALERLLEIGVALTDALAACHEADPPVIHRDVKPANVLLMGANLQPFLADFGICFLVDEDRVRVTHTEANTAGSEGYTAPELLGGGPIEGVGPAADIYSLGKTLYAVLAGGDLFPREQHRLPKWDLSARFSDPRLEHLHGILDFMVDLPGGGQAAIAATSRRVPALWSLFSRAGRLVGVVGWWATSPAETIRGTLVSDRVAPQLIRAGSDLDAEAIFPPAARARVLSLLTRPDQISDDELRARVPVSLERVRLARAALSQSNGRFYDDPVAHLATVVAATRSYGAIAEELHVSVKTVDAHRANIKEKLGLKTGNELVRYAVRWVEAQNRS